MLYTYINQVNQSLAEKFFIFRSVSKSGRVFFDIYELTIWGYEYYDTYTTLKEAKANLEKLNVSKPAQDEPKSGVNPFRAWKVSNGEVVTTNEATLSAREATLASLQPTKRPLIKALSY